MTKLAGLRIGLVGPLPPPAGGMALQTLQLAELLRAESAHVRIVSTNAPYRPAWAARWRGFRAIVRLIPYLAALWRATGRIDVLHVMANSGWSWHLFAAPAVWVGRLRRVPVVVNYRGGEAEQFLHRSARLVRASLSGSSRLVVPSGFLQEVFAQHHIAAEIVPNIVDVGRFRPIEPGLCESANTVQLIVARNLEALYDNATAIRAFAAVCGVHPQARLLVAGTGPEETKLRQLAARLDVADRVEFTGRLERGEMAARLRECRVSLNPSRADNMPNSVIEALACGVPVVSTWVGGVPYIVRDGESALLIPPGDHQAMAQAVLRLLADPDLARRLRVEGLRRIQDYTWNAVGPRWRSVYAAAMAKTTS